MKKENTVVYSVVRGNVLGVVLEPVDPKLTPEQKLNCWDVRIGPAAADALSDSQQDEDDVFDLVGDFLQAQDWLDSEE